MMILIVLLVKILTGLLRFFHIGGGTSLPGLIIEKYYPSLLTRLSKRYEKIILITGTNGKTTTQQLLTHILDFNGEKVVSNSSGANLYRGIVTSLITNLNLFAKPKSSIAVLEVEEATMPKIADYLNPDCIVVTSLYRDQLDAYGEIHQTREYIKEGIQKSENAELILNGDDENVSSLSNDRKDKVVTFHLDDPRKKDFLFERKHFDYHPKDTFKEVIARDFEVGGDLITDFTYEGLGATIKHIKFSSPGLQNIYNALAAITVAIRLFDFNRSNIINAFSTFEPAFGRGELIQVGGKKLRLLLIKNPASFSANLSMLQSINHLKLMIIINDGVADGRDVSWLWDSELEMLQNATISWITVSGKRAEDMLLRLKYSDIPNLLLNSEIEKNISKAFRRSMAKIRDGETLFILPTYTAMLEVRKVIGEISDIKEFWR